jgi:hypothetical protein
MLILKTKYVQKNNNNNINYIYIVEKNIFDIVKS